MILSQRVAATRGTRSDMIMMMMISTCKACKAKVIKAAAHTLSSVQALPTLNSTNRVWFLLVGMATNLSTVVIYF